MQEAIKKLLELSIGRKPKVGGLELTKGPWEKQLIGNHFGKSGGNARTVAQVRRIIDFEFADESAKSAFLEKIKSELNVEKLRNTKLPTKPIFYHYLLRSVERSGKPILIAVRDEDQKLSLRFLSRMPFEQLPKEMQTARTKKIAKMYQRKVGFGKPRK